MDKLTKHRIKVLESAVARLQTQIATLRAHRADDRVEHAEQYGKLNASIQQILPEALKSVPEEIQKQHIIDLKNQEARLNKKNYVWMVVTAVATALLTLFGALQFLPHG